MFERTLKKSKHTPRRSTLLNLLVLEAHPKKVNNFESTRTSAKKKRKPLNRCMRRWNYQLRRITSTSQGREGISQWPSAKSLSKKGLNDEYTHSEQRPRLLISLCIYSSMVPLMLIRCTFRNDFPLTFWCRQGKLNWDLSLLTGSHHHLIRQASISATTTGKGSFSSKLSKEAHLDTKALKPSRTTLLVIYFLGGKESHKVD